MDSCLNQERLRRRLRTPVVFAVAILFATLLFPSVASAAVTCRGKTVTINMTTNGGNGTGTAGNDVIMGTDGADTIRAGSGDDTICGGLGVDRIYGEGGSDLIDGQGGSDRIYGGWGNDTIWAGSGADDVWGGSGDDTIYGQGGQDDIWGEDGNDTIQGNQQSDKLYGGDGNDRVAGADGKDRIYGDAGNDELFGGNNTDYLYGGAGNDSLNGQAGADTADGGAGTDTCVNTETETSCNEQAPEWEYGAALKLDSFSPYDFIVSWCCTFASPQTDIFELSITDSDGTTQIEFIDPADPWEFRVSEFSGYAPEPGEAFDLSLVAKNSAGTSNPLTLTLAIPTLSVSGINEEIMDGDTTYRSADLHSFGRSGPVSEAHFTFGGACGRVITTTLFGFGDTTGMTVTDSEGNVTHHEFPNYVGENVAGTYACHDGTNITTNDLLPISCDEHGAKDIFLSSSESDPVGGSKGSPDAANFYGCDITAVGLLDWLPFVEFDLEDSIVHTISIEGGVLNIHREHFLVR